MTEIFTDEVELQTPGQPRTVAGADGWQEPVQPDAGFRFDPAAVFRDMVKAKAGVGVVLKGPVAVSGKGATPSGKPKLSQKPVPVLSKPKRKTKAAVLAEGAEGKPPRAKRNKLPEEPPKNRLEVEYDGEKYLKFDNDQDAENWGQANYRGWADGLSVQQTEAVRFWQGPEGYQAIKAVSRNSTTDRHGHPIEPESLQKARTAIPELRSALDQSVVPENVVCYRGAGLSQYGLKPEDLDASIVGEKNTVKRLFVIFTAALSRRCLLAQQKPSGFCRNPCS